MSYPSHSRRSFLLTWQSRRRINHYKQTGRRCPMPLAEVALLGESRLFRHRGASFDHLVGTGQQHGRDGEAKRFCRLEVDDQLEGRRLLDRQFARMGAAQDTIDITCRASISLEQRGAIGEQAAGGSELAK